MLKDQEIETLIASVEQEYKTLVQQLNNIKADIEKLNSDKKKTLLSVAMKKGEYEAYQKVLSKKENKEN
jgi:hypothetical protein